jgi:hypothetical protein
MLSENVLAAIRAEIASREAELSEWRELERLAVKLGGGQADPPVPAADPPTPPRARTRASATRTRQPRGDRKERKQAILSTLSTRGPLSPSAIAEATGEAMHNVRDTLRSLLTEGKVTAQGATTSRTYDVARNGSPAPAPSMSPGVRRLVDEESKSGAGQEVDLEDRVLEIVRHNGGRVALSEIEYQLRRRQVDVDRGKLEGAVRRLATHELVIRDPGGGLRLAPEPGNGERPLEQAIMDAAGVESL